jgi:aminoglycoside phosphotransferase (APT) family kinase protein
VDERARAALRDWLCGVSGADDVTLLDLRRLSGGAIQQNWRLQVEIAGGPYSGRQAWVLRIDSPSGIAASRPRDEEFCLLKVAHRAGVAVPEPLFFCGEKALLGRPFFIMRRVEGIAQGYRVVRADDLGGGRELLAETLGRQLARIHAIRPPHRDLGFLAVPEPGSQALHLIAGLRARLDVQPEPRPVLEWGLRHLERNAPPSRPPVLCHNDFRTGNLMVAPEALTAVLDWEFADWGDRLQDIGWFCARCWRFGSPHEAGGIGSRDAFYGGYEAEAGVAIERALVPYWELMATVRWAVLAADQAQRHLSGAEPSLELALTGHIVPELERDILAATASAADA